MGPCSAGHFLWMMRRNSVQHSLPSLSVPFEGLDLPSTDGSRDRQDLSSPSAIRPNHRKGNAVEVTHFFFLCPNRLTVSTANQKWNNEIPAALVTNVAAASWPRFVLYRCCFFVGFFLQSNRQRSNKVGRYYRRDSQPEITLHRQP